MKIMVAYDGTLQAKEALAYGMEKAREKGGEVVALCVFDSGPFIDYDVADAEAVARQEASRFVEEAKSLLREKSDGVRTSLYTAEGNPEEVVTEFVREKKVDVLLCPPKFKSVLRKYNRAVSGAGTANPVVLSTETMEREAVCR